MTKGTQSKSAWAARMTKLRAKLGRPLTLHEIMEVSLEAQTTTPAPTRRPRPLPEIVKDITGSGKEE